MSGRTPRLRHRLDQDVYQIVRKLEDDSPKGLSIPAVYDAIKRSNSSLARQKKRPLEDAIETVLAVRKDERRADEGDEDDSDAAIEEAEAKALGESARDANVLNRQLAKAWGFSKPSPSASASAAASAPGSPPKDSGKNEMDIDSPAGAADRQANGEPKRKKRKGERQEVDRTPQANVSILDLGGVDDILENLFQEVWFPLNGGGFFLQNNYRCDHGVLLHGPTGCGKTTLVHAMAASAGAPFIPVSAPSIVGGTSGESEKNIRDIFDEAIRLAPSLVFFDEIDTIAGRRDNAQKGMESRIVAEIMNGMDRIKNSTPMGKNVVVVAATNRPDALEPGIRRRFNTEVAVGMPNEGAREQILRLLSRRLNLAEEIDFRELAKLTPGYVGSDLENVVKAALAISSQASIHRMLDDARALRPDDLTQFSPWQRNWVLAEDHRSAAWSESPVTFEQFKAGVSRVQPAAKREGFSTIPDTTWAHVGAMEGVREKLEMSIIGPIKEPEMYSAVGIQPAAGILLWGPPGCGKTLVAKAVANESKANFISIKGPELLNKYVGESERAVRQLFSRAKSSAPCILFFDEMDALVPKRDDSLSDASSRVVNALLTELDGVGDRSGIYVIGATNRPDIIDEAIRRPGRLGTSIYVGLPSPAERVAILRTLYRHTIAPAAGGALPAELEPVALDRRCHGYSGADLGNLMQAAAQSSLRRAHAQRKDGAPMPKPAIAMEDWQVALSEVKPSVKDIEKYAMDF